MANNIEGIYMPELIIYNFIKTIQKILKKDFEENLDKSKTLLNSLFEKDRDEKKTTKDKIRKQQKNFVISDQLIDNIINILFHMM